MAAEWVVLQDLDGTDEAIARAARLLAEGALVVFPTETVYGLAANADDETAVGRLYEAKGRPARKPLSIHLGDVEEAERYIGPQRGRARRLMARGWPGPLTLVFDRRPDAPGEPGTGRETVGLRLPDHSVARAVLRQAGVPVVASSANLSGNASPTTGQEVMDNVGEAVALVLDDGPTRFGRGSTVVRVSDTQLEVLREGVVSRRGVQQSASLRVAFVCSGNTCRSPMAEAIARRLLARRLNVRASQLVEAGFEVRSGGTGALGGGAASDTAVATMSRMGYDAAGHVTRAMTAADVARTDLVFTMTEAQRATVAAMWPDAADRVHRLDANADVADPVGGSADLFRECAEQIERAVSERLAMILEAAEE